MEQQNTTPSSTTHVVVIAKQKSVGMALLLSFLFGPLGLLYASVTGGIIMIILSIVIGIFTFGIGLIFTWIGSIIWAVVAANASNQKIASQVSAVK